MSHLVTSCGKLQLLQQSFMLTALAGALLSWVKTLTPDFGSSRTFQGLDLSLGFAS